MKHTLTTLIGFAVLLSAAFAQTTQPPRLKHKDAYELYVALSAIEGLDAAKTLAAADNLLALRPVIEAYEARIKALERSAYRAKIAARKDPLLLADIELRLLEFAEAQDAEHAAEVPPALALKELELTADDITAAKLRPAHVAILRGLKRPAVAAPAIP